MSITAGEVRRVAALARLELSDHEVEGLVRDLRGILEHMDALEEADSSPVDPDRPGPSVALRADEPGADPLTDGISFAPAVRNGFIAVPRIAPGEDGP